MMVHLATVCTTLGIKNSSPLSSLVMQVPCPLGRGSVDAFPYGWRCLKRIVCRGIFSIGTLGPPLFACAQCLPYQRGFFFKRVGWESISINAQDFNGSFRKATRRAGRPTSKAVLHFCSWSKTAWNNALPSLGAMTSHTSWHASPAFWKNSDITGKGYFSRVEGQIKPRKQDWT